MHRPHGKQAERGGGREHGAAIRATWTEGVGSGEHDVSLGKRAEREPGHGIRTELVGSGYHNLTHGNRAERVGISGPGHGNSTEQ